MSRRGGLDKFARNLASLSDFRNITISNIVFDRSREQGGANEKRKDVFFIDARREFANAKTQSVLEDGHIEKILETYRRRKEIEKYSHKATAKEIAENDYNLNISRYVDTFEPEAEIDVAAVQKEIVAIEAELADVRKRMAKHLKELGIDA